MTLRQFVDVGSVGTREQRVHFENGMLDGWADAAVRGIDISINPDVAPGIWEATFKFWARLHLGREL